MTIDPNREASMSTEFVKWYQECQFSPYHHHAPLYAAWNAALTHAASELHRLSNIEKIVEHKQEQIMEMSGGNDALRDQVRILKGALLKINKMDGDTHTVEDASNVAGSAMLALIKLTNAKQLGKE